MAVWKGGGYVSLDHFLLRFTGVAIGVGGAAWLNIAGICRVLAMLFIYWVYSFDPMGAFLWCTHSIWMAQLFVLGLVRSSGGIVGSS